MKNVSFNDILVVAGLIMIGVGLWLYRPWISLSVLGVILMLMGVYPYIRITKQ